MSHRLREKGSDRKLATFKYDLVMMVQLRGASWYRRKMT